MNVTVLCVPRLGTVRWQKEVPIRFWTRNSSAVLQVERESVILSFLSKALRFQLWKVEATPTVHAVFINSGHTPRHTVCARTFLSSPYWLSDFFPERINSVNFKIKITQTFSFLRLSSCFSTERKLDASCASVIRIDNGLLTDELPHRGQRVTWPRRSRLSVTEIDS